MLAPTTPVKGVTPVTMATDEDEQSRHLGDVTGDVMRMQRVKNKLESVMVRTTNFFLSLFSHVFFPQNFHPD